MSEKPEVAVGAAAASMVSDPDNNSQGVNPILYDLPWYWGQACIGMRGDDGIFPSCLGFTIVPQIVPHICDAYKAPIQGKAPIDSEFDTAAAMPY